MFRWSKNYTLGFIKSHLVDYPTPINLNFMWSFGFLGGMCLVWQLLTGIFLAMHYIPDAETAFSSVEHIMREVNYGWLLRYGHANGASMFFILIYSHLFRGLYYSSYSIIRKELWISGILIFILMMATAFLGYVLPWGQMSYWGATVITNLFSSIPIVGGSIVEWLWGGFSVSSPTLNRFFSLHYLLPFLITGVVIIHLSLLHKDGSTNPLSLTQKQENISFHSYFIIKDVFAFVIFIFVLCFFIFYYPNTLGHPDNYIKGSSLSTPEHIVPEWYFLPFYAILRTMPTKLGGVITMFGAIVILLFLPFIITNDLYQGSQHRLHFKIFFWLIFFDFVLLGWIGQKPVEYPYSVIGVYTTGFYFFYFLVILPLLSEYDNA